MKRKFGIVVIDDDKETARKGLQQISRIPEEQINEFVIYGAPEVCSQIYFKSYYYGLDMTTYVANLYTKLYKNRPSEFVSVNIIPNLFSKMFFGNRS